MSRTGKLFFLGLLGLACFSGNAQSHGQADPLDSRPALDPDHLVFHVPMEDGIFFDEKQGSGSTFTN